MEVGVHFSFDQQKSELREVKNLENIACTSPQLYINSILVERKKKQVKNFFRRVNRSKIKTKPPKPLEEHATETHVEWKSSQLHSTRDEKL